MTYLHFISIAFNVFLYRFIVLTIKVNDILSVEKGLMEDFITNYNVCVKCTLRITQSAIMAIANAEPLVHLFTLVV